MGWVAQNQGGGACSVAGVALTYVLFRESKYVGHENYRHIWRVEKGAFLRGDPLLRVAVAGSAPFGCLGAPLDVTEFLRPLEIL